ncbi:DUF881 domain-containing protein [Bifidobacterium sp. BRDM6]|uniref:DUF881 domain-containing protein n=2 Tax=Bifidobacterium choloepi TaxID=2614131 RepID=A0A6I5MXV5_9BIFI|nr:DUF881 domain-containing protein [Bifidobacterium choloepi]
MPPVYPVSQTDKPVRRRAVFSRGAFAVEGSHVQSPSAGDRASRRPRRGVDDSMQLIDDLTNRPLDVLYTDSRLNTKPDSKAVFWATRIVVFVICIAVGFVSCLFVRLLQSDPRKEIRATLASQLSDAEHAESDLQSSISKLEQQIKAQKDTKQDTTAIDTVREDRMMSGLLAVEGPGISLSLADPVDSDGTVTTVISDLDLQQLVMLTWQAGAEAVAVNGVRIGQDTSIRTAGSQILVGTTPVESPYKIQAIGDKNSLADFMGETNLKSLYDSYAKLGVTLQLTKSNSMKLAGATDITLSYAEKEE